MGTKITFKQPDGKDASVLSPKRRGPTGPALLSSRNGGAYFEEKTKDHWDLFWRSWLFLLWLSLLGGLTLYAYIIARLAS